MSKSNDKNKKSTKSKLTMGFLYQKCNHDENNGIIEILDKTKLTANVKNFLKYNKYKFIVFLVVLITLMIISFREQPILILYALILLLIMLVMGAMSCTYTIKLVEEGVKVRYKFQDYDIKYENLVNIYMSKSKIGFFLNTYFINMIYIENEKSVMKFTLPLIMANRREIKDFFGKLKTQSIDEAEPLDPDQKMKKNKNEKETDEEILQKEKMKKVLTLFIAGSIAIIVIVIGVVVAIKIK